MTPPDAADGTLPGCCTSPRSQSARLRIVGCGRHLRQDDGVGLRVAEALSGLAGATLVVTTSEAPGADLPLGLDDLDLLIIVDAARTPDAAAGDWRRIVWRAEGANQPNHALLRAVEPLTFATSGHTLGVIDALRVAEALGTLPRNVWIYAIFAENFGFGADLSLATSRAATEVARAIPLDIAAWRRETGGDSHSV